MTSSASQTAGQQDVSDILSQGAVGLRDAVVSGALTPSEIADACLDRFAATEERLQAFTQLDEQAIRAEAATLTAEAERGQIRGPLHGVPVSIKEWFDIEGYPTLLRGDDAGPAAQDSTVVAKLRAAGAIIFGKTQVPFGEKPPPTRNPWNLDYSPGGSSSGAAVSVASRVVPLAIGEQTVGSILRPAAYCGIAAIKPTYGTISRFGMFPAFWSRDHPGIMGRNMEDVALGLSVTGGYDENDPTTIVADAPRASLDAGQAPRIGLVQNIFPEITGPIMLEAVATATERMSAGGAEILDVRLPKEFEPIWEISSLSAVEMVTQRAQQLADKGQVTLADLGSGTPAINKASRRATELLPATYYLQARRYRTWLTRLLRQLMEEQNLDALLMAVAPEPAPKGLETTGNPLLLSPWSFLGFPAITVNAGRDETGLPYGVQMVSTPRRDHSLMCTGAFAERCLGVLPAPTL